MIEVWVMVLAVVGAVLGGAVLGAVAALQVRRRLQVPPTPPELLRPPEPVIPLPAMETLRMLRSANAVLGPHDQVVHASAAARSLGIVRGSRLAVPVLLDLVREVRRSGGVRARDVDLGRGTGQHSVEVHARVGRLGEDLVVVLADDRTQARRLEATRRDFVANVSHELKTPIGAVSLLAEAIADEADDPDQVRHFAERCRTEAARLTELVAQIIELSRLQSDDPLLEAEEVDVDDLLAEAVDATRTQAGRREVGLTIGGVRGTVVRGDRQQLATAVRNLVQNAVVYSDPGARVVVSANTVTDDGEEWVDLRVSDTGIGISSDDIDRIFERFYRVDYARSRANGGTGLGLSMVKHIAAAHGGRVTVWSRLGSGSTFTVRVPALTADAHDADEADDAFGSEIGAVPAREARLGQNEAQVPTGGTARGGSPEVVR